MECYEAAVATKPDFWLALNNLGVLYTAQGHSGKAERHLRAAIAANSKYAEAYNNMGVLLRDRGLVAEVRTAYHALQFLHHALQVLGLPSRGIRITTSWG